VDDHEAEFVAVFLDSDAVAGLDVATEHFLGHRVFDVFLHSASHGAGAVGRVVAFGDEEILRGGVEREVNVLGLDAFDHLRNFEVHDFDEVGLLEGVENNDVVEAVDELRFEDALGLTEDFLLHDIVVVGATRWGAEA